MYIMNKIPPARIIGLANSVLHVYTLSFSGYSQYHSKSFNRSTSELVQIKDVIKHIERK